MTLNENQAARSALETFKTHRIRLHIQGLKACDTAVWSGNELEKHPSQDTYANRPSYGKKQGSQVVGQRGQGSLPIHRSRATAGPGVRKVEPDLSAALERFQASSLSVNQSRLHPRTPGVNQNGPRPRPDADQKPAASPCLRQPSALQSSSPAPRSRVALPRGRKPRQAPRTGCSPPHSPAAHAASSGAARAGSTRLRR